MLLQAGYSEPWEDTLEDMTGVDGIDVRPLLEYFKPLQDYLMEQNKKSGEFVGWDDGAFLLLFFYIYIFLVE
jgi:hypothetical protein